MTSSQRRFFNTPECLKNLSLSLDKKDLACLASSSRTCYESAIPVIWREVRGVHHLFALIPGVEVQEVGYNEKSIEIPDLFTCDFARFNIYSPLKLAFGCEKSRDNTYINWIAAFLSPTVIEINTYNVGSFNRSDLSFPAVLGFLQLVAERCPLLSAISLFPAVDFLAHNRGDSEDEGWRAPIDVASSTRDFDRVWAVSYPEPRPYNLEPLGRAQYLVHLTSNVYILDCEVLKLLGSLPHLGHLTIFDEFTAHELLDYSYDELKENAFPALRKLSLLILPNALIPRIWSITPLVRRLTHVTIWINDDEQGGNQYLDPFESEEPTSLVDFLPTLCELSPNLVEFLHDLDAVFGGNSMGVFDSTAQVFSRMALRSLASLPLQKLDLRVVKLHPMSQMCETLASCSTLRELYLQHEPVTFMSLMHFTQLASLERLQVSVTWESIGTLDACLRAEKSPSSVFRYLQCSRAPPQKLSEKIKKLASYLIALWPNLFKVSYVAQSPYPLGPPRPDPDFFSHLSAC